jgi:hypothetical protein
MTSHNSAGSNASAEAAPVANAKTRAIFGVLKIFKGPTPPALRLG